MCDIHEQKGLFTESLAMLELELEICVDPSTIASQFFINILETTWPMNLQYRSLESYGFTASAREI